MYPSFQKISELTDIAEILSNIYTPPEISILKQNTRYLFNFLVIDLKASYVLKENDYFSQSYFDDYKFFHVNSYKDFSKTCVRVHFFSSAPPIKRGALHSLFDNGSTDKKIIKFWESYLGYIVIRPIPSGIIGATLLKCPQAEDEHYKKKLTIKINNSINIFGYQYNNFETLIYQEQDKIVGACATASLWSVLDRAKDLFGTPTYSPSKLTQIALQSHDGKIPQRRYPNTKGLTVMQIAHVIEALNLDYDIAMYRRTSRSENLTDRIQEFKDFIYAYIKYGFPILLAVKFDDDDLHSLNLIGYKEPKDKVLLHKLISKHPKGEKEPIYKAHFIEDFYVHDDQLGPFAEIKLEAIDKVHIQWDDTKMVKFDMALAIIHPTWIVDISVIKKHISVLHDLLRSFKYNIEGNSYWEYYIAPSNKWKNDLAKSGIVFNSDVIYKSLPQYVWVIEHYRVSNAGSEHKSIPIFTLLIDTTSLSPLRNIMDIIIFDLEFKNFIKENESEISAMEKSLNTFIKSQTVMPKNLIVCRRQLYLLDIVFRQYRRTSK